MRLAWSINVQSGYCKNEGYTLQVSKVGSEQNTCLATRCNHVQTCLLVWTLFGQTKPNQLYQNCNYIISPQVFLSTIRLELNHSAIPLIEPWV